jgi:nucleoside-diphosphate-sugar epimerase
MTAISLPSKRSTNAFRAAAAESQNIDVVFHIAALVGPYYEKKMYDAVNYEGTRRIIRMCQKYKVLKLVYSSSPSTRFTGRDIEGLREDQLEIPTEFVAPYAESKARGEVEVAKACDPPNFMSVSIAPHQIYGPHDNLFLPSLLSAAGKGRLRIFGNGGNKISVCYVDNYIHGLLCGADSLYENSPALGGFYIIVDDEFQFFWDFINQSIVEMGFDDLTKKYHLPVWFLYGLAYMLNIFGFLSRRRFQLNPFVVTMLTIHRYFSIENAKKDLNYVPLFKTEQAWPSTIAWFQEHWLPTFAVETKQFAHASHNDRGGVICNTNKKME